ncbi:hypothetical protein LCGC14_0897530 [marine sediment metagenome]|uniref:Uncharacterized protein n=1 Tax=marine sediment metagenome TaxID=412755 RepID=A0A0F9PI73_9ZZZZ
MPRTTVVNKARIDQGLCRKCRTPIKAGDPYKWAHPRYKAKVVVCANCQITPSMTSSSKMVAVWEAQESYDGSDVETIEEQLKDLAQAARDVGAEYQEAADNQHEYFADSPIADENEEKAQALDGWADELETAAEEADSGLQELRELGVEQEMLQGEQAELTAHDLPKDGEVRLGEIKERLAAIEDEWETMEADILEHGSISDDCPV